MYFYIILIFIFIILSFLIYYHLPVVENFENSSKIKDGEIDKLYVKLFDKVFDEKKMYEGEYLILDEFLKRQKKVKILECGVGLGKHYQYLSKKYIKRAP